MRSKPVEVGAGECVMSGQGVGDAGDVGLVNAGVAVLEDIGVGVSAGAGAVPLTGKAVSALDTVGGRSTGTHAAKRTRRGTNAT